jgi:hypothetical protein
LFLRQQILQRRFKAGLGRSDTFAGRAQSEQCIPKGSGVGIRLLFKIS